MEADSYILNTSFLQQDESQVNQEKFGLIVVGRMGHGKSSFCKMLACNEQKHKIDCKASVTSVTDKCQIFRSVLSDEIFGCIYVIDTPGLDSKSALYLTVQDIDQIIIKQKLNIIGIAYVIDIHQREQNSEGNSFVFPFLQILRIKYCIKKNLSFCILSKFDKYYEEEQQNQDIFAELTALFQKKGFLQTWNRKIKWMSQPSKDLNKFHKKISQDEQCKQLFLKQKESLSIFIKDIWKNNYYLKYSQYEKDRLSFQKSLRNQLIQNYNQFQYSKEQFSFRFTVKIVETCKSGAKVKGLVAVGAGGMGVVQGLCLGIASTVSMVALPALAITGGLTVIGLISYKIYKLLQQINSTKHTPVISSDKKQVELLEKMTNKLKACLITACSEHTIVNQYSLQFAKIPYITSMRCFNTKKEELKVLEKDGKWKATLEEGENIIEFTCCHPSNESFKQFMEKISRMHYNQQK